MRDWTCENMRDGLIDVVTAVRNYGDVVSPRGMVTSEISPGHLTLERPWDSLPTGIGRTLKPAIAIVEALQLIAGEQRPELLISIAPNTEKFVSADRTFHGAYGPRVKESLVKVVRLLAREPDTRQAVVNIWDQDRDLHPQADGRPPDIPCTISLHFMVRKQRLELHTHMRSNDVWWGLTYDVFQFTQLQLTMAKALKLGAGRYHHHADSLHLYERDFEAVKKLHRVTTRQGHEAQEKRWSFHGVGVNGMGWEELVFRARCALDGKRPPNATEDENRMLTILEAYR